MLAYRSLKWFLLDAQEQDDGKTDEPQAVESPSDYPSNQGNPTHTDSKPGA
jgi:hypothetical protein